MPSVLIDGKRYTLLSDSALPRGRRAQTRFLRDAQPSDPGRTRIARWKVSGPIGASREGDTGYLGTDYTVDLDHHNVDLLTSTAARNTVDLTTDDPIPGGTAPLGGFALGSVALGAGTGAADPARVQFMDEDRAYLFTHRGAFSTQVDIAAGTPSVIQSVAHSVNVRGASVWFGKGYLGHGGARAMQRRTAVTSSGSTYEDVQISGSDEYASAMTVGSDRLWMVDADESAGDENKIKFSLDDLSSVSNSFIVGDHKIPATGLGTIGPLTIAGSEVGAFGFTDTGKPVRILETLRGHRSANNGKRMASLWGWLYITTDIGLYAWDGGTTVNPAGIEALGEFEGPIDGRPLDVWAYKDALWCVYLTETGDSWILRGVFGDETPRSGMPDWFVFKRLSSTQADVLFSTSLRTNPTLLSSEGADTLAYYTLGRRGREIADANYVFGTTGGQWFGTTLMRSSTMLNVLRYATFFTENCTATNTWRLAVLVDEGGRDDATDYFNVGATVSTNGLSVVTPEQGGRPNPSAHFATLKPRLTQVTASSTAPPQIRGVLEIAYDERPLQIEEAAFVIQIERQEQLDDLFALARPSIDEPVPVRPDGERVDRYGHVARVTDVQDYEGDGLQSVAVTVHFWDVR